MGTFKRGRERVILETRDNAGDIRIYDARNVRVNDDTVSYTCREIFYTCPRTSVVSAIEFESGDLIPSLSRYGQDVETGIHDLASFSRALAVEVEQALKHNSALSYLVGKIRSGDGDKIIEATHSMLAVARELRWGDLVAKFDDETIMALLPCCDGADASMVAQRLASHFEREQSEAQIDWQGGTILLLTSNSTLGHPDFASLGDYRFGLVPRDRNQDSGSP